MIKLTIKDESNLLKLKETEQIDVGVAIVPHTISFASSVMPTKQEEL